MEISWQKWTGEPVSDIYLTMPVALANRHFESWAIDDVKHLAGNIEKLARDWLKREQKFESAPLSIVGSVACLALPNTGGFDDFLANESVNAMDYYAAVIFLMGYRRVGLLTMGDDAERKLVACNAAISYQAEVTPEFAVGITIDILKKAVPYIEKRTKSRIGNQGRETRWATKRKLMEQAVGVAEAKWHETKLSDLNHSQMTQYLLNEHSDSDGKVVFLELNEKTLRRNIAELARRLGKTVIGVRK